jgi:hypothetical protein
MPQAKTYDDVRSAFDAGTVVDAPKDELEQLLLAVGRARVLDPANQARAAEMGETMRQLLAARQSEAMHAQALSVSRLALWVSLIALLASIVQIAAALNLVGPLKRPAFELEAPVPAKPASGPRP